MKFNRMKRTSNFIVKNHLYKYLMQNISLLRKGTLKCNRFKSLFLRDFHILAPDAEQHAVAINGDVVHVDFLESLFLQALLDLRLGAGGAGDQDHVAAAASTGNGLKGRGNA